MAIKPSHCLEFSLTIIFKANFLLTEKQVCILKTFTNRLSISKNKKLSDLRNLRYHGNNTIKLFYIHLKDHFMSKSSYDRKSNVPIYNTTCGLHIPKQESNIVVNFMLPWQNSVKPSMNIPKNRFQSK